MSLQAPSIDSLALQGKTVLIRVDFNVPRDAQGSITDDTRIRAALPTLRAVLAGGGKPVCLMHLGRPKGQVVEDLRVSAIGKRLEELMELPVTTLTESTGQAVSDSIAGAPAHGVVLLENVRFHGGETQGDPELSKSYAALGDLFINDAFGASHRAHSSVSGIAGCLPSAAGLLLEKEVQAFGRILNDPARPFVAILGGAKVSDKLTVIENLLDKVDVLVVGGGMAYTFLAAQGHSVGISLVEENQIDLCKAALAKAAERGVRLLLPVDHVVADRFAADAEASVSGVDIPEGRMALDIGPKTQELYAAEVEAAKTVVWNGPMGVFEMEAFRAGTARVGQALANCSGYTVVGGGDSVAAIGMLGLESAVDHISTGGGASLELLEGKALPGIAALGQIA
ncbi:MAG: phosphoglycerate kinase [Planctomycetota bacterium]|nr:phosphoglycerate kinase [Planctomycetota bacterium]